jgi:hypothetical protein
VKKREEKMNGENMELLKLKIKKPKSKKRGNKSFLGKSNMIVRHRLHYTVEYKPSM